MGMQMEEEEGEERELGSERKRKVGEWGREGAR